jgi:hypothetical protein
MDVSYLSGMEILFQIPGALLALPSHEFTAHFAALMELYVQRCGMCGMVLVDNTGLMTSNEGLKSTGFAKWRPVFTSGAVRTIVLPPHFNLCPGFN